MWASVQTIRGCPKHCSFCSVWRTDGQKPRQRGVESVIGEIVELRRQGFKFVALADDNFYPVTLTNLRQAREQGNMTKLAELERVRAERFLLMEYLAKLPNDMTFFTQITMEAAEDGEYLDAMKRAHIKGALVGVEAVTAEGLKAVFKDFNYHGDGLVEQLKKFREHGVHILGSFIFGLPTDRADTFQATAELAIKAEITFCAVCDADAISGNGGLRTLGERSGRDAGGGVGGSGDAILADSTARAAKDVYASPGDGIGRDAGADAGGLGPLL